MPNLKHLEVLDIRMDQWLRMTDEEKAEATKRAAQIISDSHDPVNISYGQRSRSSKRGDDVGGTQ